MPTLWQLLHAADRRVVSLNLPMTYPPPRVRGLIVSGAEAPGPEWAFAQCPDFGVEVAAKVPDFSQRILWKRRPRSFEELQATAMANRANFRALADVAELADERVDWTALMVHFHNLDSLQHRLWPELELGDSAPCEPGWGAEVRSCLRALDDACGRLLELASRRDAAVIALSDHGFGPCRAVVNVNGLLRQAGLQRGLAYGTRFRYRAHRLMDRARRWQARRAPGGPATKPPKSIRGEVGCDWRRTLAFAPFGQLSANVFLAPGTRSNASAADRAAAEVIGACLDARDPETGDRLFADAFSVADRYDLDPTVEGLPDILAPSADGYQAVAKWSPFDPSVLKAEPNLPATHYRDGILAIDGPDIRPGSHLDADLHDVAPTALALLGLGIPSGMEGRPVQAAFEEPIAYRLGGRPYIEVDPERDARLVAAGFGGSNA